MRISLKNFSWKHLRIYARWTFIFGGIAVALGFLLTLGAVQVTSRPNFCGSCHLMEPYYQSWKNSKHVRVACVECHIPHGVKEEVKKKYEALSMVVSYITGTYSTKPWTVVEDNNCLACHERSLLSGPIQFKNARFNHAAHFYELESGVKFRCTVCHAQKLRSIHFSVDSALCILCHFKSEEANGRLKECTLCHTIPESVTLKDGRTFQHSEVKEYRMQCQWCHGEMHKGEGDVSIRRCFTCHNEERALKLFGKMKPLHVLHTAESKVDCLNCHDEIKHVSSVHLSVKGGCESCHSPLHEKEHAIYTGQVKTLQAEFPPNPMYAVHVRCEGCHFLKNGKPFGIARASVVSCMACHGPSYKKIYNNWLQALEQARNRLRIALNASRQIRTPERQKLEHAFEWISEKSAIHNPIGLVQWASEMYENLSQQLKTETGQSLPVWKPFPYQASCFQCHVNIAEQSGRYRTVRFRHERHVLTEEMTCDDCHRSHEEKPGGELIAPDTECVDCHHDTERSCQSCHTYLPQTIRLSWGIRFPHEKHAGKELEIECDSCHETGGQKPDKSVCLDCHDTLPGT